MRLNNYFEQIVSHAEESPAREVCGFLFIDGQGSLVAKPAKNIATDNNTWRIHSEEAILAFRSGRLFATYHSHIADDEVPSESDIESSESCEVPFFIYSRVTRKFAYYRPKVLIPQLEGRCFIAGVQDCYSLVQDYFDVKFGIKIPFCVRTPQNIEKGLNLNLEDLVKDNFDRVTDGSLRENDILTFSIGNQGIENHTGVYVKDGVLLHQLQGRVSAMQSYTESWRRNNVKVFRIR
jgi:proteasome lid subunit RPN8/RPN11